MSKTPSAQRLSLLEQPPGTTQTVYRALSALKCILCATLIPPQGLHTRSADRAGKTPGLRYPLCERCAPIITAPSSSGTHLECIALPVMPPEGTDPLTTLPSVNLKSAVSPARSSKSLPPVIHYLTDEQTWPDELPHPCGELVLHVALLVEDGLERLSVGGRLRDAKPTLTGALQHADAWYARHRAHHRWPALRALSCPSRTIAVTNTWRLGLGAPLTYTSGEHPTSQQAQRAAQRWALENPILAPLSRPTPPSPKPNPLSSSASVQPTPPVQADVLIFVDMSAHPKLGAAAWGAVIIDLITGQEFEAFGPLTHGTEMAGIQAAHAWLSVTLPERQATIFNDSKSCHATIRTCGWDVRYLPRDAPFIQRAHNLARNHHHALLAWQGVNSAKSTPAGS